MLTDEELTALRLDAILALRCQITGDTAGLVAIINANEERVPDFLAALLGLAEAGFTMASADPAGLLAELAERTRSGAS